MNDLVAHDRKPRESTGRGRADLHVHTLYSDGGQSPEAVVRAAAGRVDVVGITDHDRVGGALRARDYAREHPELRGGRGGGRRRSAALPRARGARGVGQRPAAPAGSGAAVVAVALLRADALPGRAARLRAALALALPAPDAWARPRSTSATRPPGALAFVHDQRATLWDIAGAAPVVIEAGGLLHRRARVPALPARPGRLPRRADRAPGRRSAGPRPGAAGLAGARLSAGAG